MRTRGQRARRSRRAPRIEQLARTLAFPRDFRLVARVCGTWGHTGTSLLELVLAERSGVERGGLVHGRSSITETQFAAFERAPGTRVRCFSRRWRAACCWCRLCPSATPRSTWRGGRRVRGHAQRRPDTGRRCWLCRLGWHGEQRHELHVNRPDGDLAFRLGADDGHDPADDPVEQFPEAIANVHGRFTGVVDTFGPHATFAAQQTFATGSSPFRYGGGLERRRPARPDRRQGYDTTVSVLLNTTAPGPPPPPSPPSRPSPRHGSSPDRWRRRT